MCAASSTPSRRNSASTRDPNYAKLKADLDARERALADQQRDLEKARAGQRKAAGRCRSRAGATARARAGIAKAPSRAGERERTGRTARVAPTQKDNALAQARRSRRELQQQARRRTISNARMRRRNSTARACSSPSNARRTRKAPGCSSMMEGQLREKRQELASERSQMAALQAQLDSESGPSSGHRLTRPPASAAACASRSCSRR